MDGKADCHADCPGCNDGAQKHFHRPALRHADDYSHHHPNLDAHTEPHTATHLHCLADSNAASYHHFNTHAYAASYMDGVSNAYTDYTESYLDSFTDAYTYIDPNAHLHANTNGNPHTLRRVTISHML
jgi:hypothetical protein